MRLFRSVWKRTRGGSCGSDLNRTAKSSPLSRPAPRLQSPPTRRSLRATRHKIRHLERMKRRKNERKMERGREKRKEWKRKQRRWKRKKWQWWKPKKWRLRLKRTLWSLSCPRTNKTLLTPMRHNHFRTRFCKTYSWSWEALSFSFFLSIGKFFQNRTSIWRSNDSGSNWKRRDK